MGTDRIEVPERDDRESACRWQASPRICSHISFERAYGLVGPARPPRLWACCTGAVDGAGRREDQRRTSCSHRPDQADRAGDVGVVVVERYLHGLPDGFPGREMDDGVNVVLGEYRSRAR